MPTVEGEGGRSGIHGGSAIAVVAGVDRRGEPWSDRESERLVEAITAGVAVPEVARAHGRSVKAIQAQLAAMAPASVTGKRAEVARVVVARLRAGERLDWRSALRERRRVYWSQEDDAALRQSWEARENLPAMAARCGVEELDVHVRLVSLGLSGSYAATVERVGCSAAGIVEARYMKEVGRSPTVAVMLLASGTVCRAGGPVPFYASNHSSREAARAALRALRREHQDNLPGLPSGFPVRPVSWLILPRPIDSNADLGADESGAFGEDRERDWEQ